jgi:MFS superfamily sulfate permease-like transporter
VFGTSDTHSVAPVAVVSLMTAAALAKLELRGVIQYTSAITQQ